MDDRTLEKYRQQERIRHHLLQGRRGQLPEGMDVITALNEGRQAADMLDRALMQLEMRHEVNKLTRQVEDLNQRKQDLLAELERIDRTINGTEPQNSGSEPPIKPQDSGSEQPTEPQEVVTESSQEPQPDAKEQATTPPMKHYKLSPQSCAYCGKTFQPKSQVHRYCSETCKRKFKAEQRENKRESQLQNVEAVCEECKKPFTKQQPTQKFCSPQCRWRYTARKVREESAKTKVPANADIKSVMAQGMHYCERLQLKTLGPTPCGKIAICFSPRCSRCPKEAVPPKNELMANEPLAVGDF